VEKHRAEVGEKRQKQEIRENRVRFSQYRVERRVWWENRRQMQWYAPKEESGDPSLLLATEGRPDQKADCLEELIALQKAISELPEELKGAFILTALEGRQQSETAELLGISLKAVEMRVYRARKLLLEQMSNTELVVIRPKVQPARSAQAKAAAAHCGVANGESNALSQFWRPARDGVFRLWILDQTVALKSVGRSGRGRRARALRSSSKRDSFILLYRTTRQTFPSSCFLSYFNERKGLIPQNSDHFF
jgi:RNA polymerase sigma factor (sigma-70 family)